jgi:hypothetical protein
VQHDGCLIQFSSRWALPMPARADQVKRLRISGVDVSSGGHLNETLYASTTVLQSTVQTLLVSTMQVTTQITVSHLPASGTVPRIPVTYVLGGSTRSWQSYSPAKQSTERQWWYIQFTGAVESAVISIWQSSRQHLQGHHA